MTPDPSEWYQRRPGGAWCRHGDRNSYHIKICVHCGEEALMKRRERFCSQSCNNQAFSRGAAATAGPDHHKWTGDRVTYNAMHKRVRSALGPAREKQCVDCGGEAAEWSKRKGTAGLQPEDYEPRCIECHRTYDGQTKAARI
jgi:hypothetical protein